MLRQFRRQIYLSPIPGAGLFAVMLRVKTRKKFLSLCWHEYNCIKTDTHRHRHFMGNVWPRCPRTCGQQAFWVLHPPHHSLPFPRPPQMGMFYVQPRPSRQGCVVTVPHAATRVHMHSLHFCTVVPLVDSLFCRCPQELRLDLGCEGYVPHRSLIVSFK